MSDSVLDRLKESLLNMDPVTWAEKSLTLDGKPYRVIDSGYRPIAEIMRYIGIKALEKDSKPVVWCKARQISGTVTSTVLEMFFMGSGLFGVGTAPPMRVAHLFPFKDHALDFSKVKLSAMIENSRLVDDPSGKRGKKPLLRSLLDTSSATNDNLQFKQFKGGNHIWIESAGLDGGRMRGKSIDSIFFDECFPYNQFIETIDGKLRIGTIYNLWIKNKPLPLIKTYNEKTSMFEYKKITHAKCNGVRELIQINCGNRSIRCTDNHKFLTTNGWTEAKNLKPGVLLKTSNGCTLGFIIVKNITHTNKKEKVYDITVEDNHNFIICSSTRTSKGKNLGGPIVHNCQDISATAIANCVKTLTKSNYGPILDGIQVYFGTPKQRGSAFWEMWQRSSQQYYHLGCCHCQEFFPLYTPNSNDWETTWVRENIVKCIFCGTEQDRLEGINRGKWIATKNPDDCPFIGFHLNQLYLPEITKEKLVAAKPGNSPINTERAYQNEVLGEFFQGDAGIISIEEIRDKCGDPERKFRSQVTNEDELFTFLGVDIGAKADIEQLADSDKIKTQGQSYSTAVVISAGAAHKLSIEFALKFKKNDLASKKQILDEIIKKYKIKLAVCDIGFAHDFNEIMQTAYGDKFLASRAEGVKKNKISFDPDNFPKVIGFERDHWIMELYDHMRKGLVRFPLGSYDYVGWLMQHCCNMEIKPTITRTGEVNAHYVKSGPNDGFMALLNAYLAYKFYLTKGFKIHNGILQDDIAKKQKPSVLAVYAPRNH